MFKQMSLCDFRKTDSGSEREYRAVLNLTQDQSQQTSGLSIGGTCFSVKDMRRGLRRQIRGQRSHEADLGSGEAELGSGEADLGSGDADLGSGDGGFQSSRLRSASKASTLAMGALQ